MVFSSSSFSVFQGSYSLTLESWNYARFFISVYSRESTEVDASCIAHIEELKNPMFIILTVDIAAMIMEIIRLGHVSTFCKLQSRPR